MNRSSRSALVALLALAFVPWVVQLNAPGDLTAVMSWGLLNTNPWHALPLPGYFGETQGLETLPWSLQVWPLGFGFYCGALLSAASGVATGREDVRVTVGLLALSAITSVVVWWGLLGRGAAGPIPVGVLATAIVGWWFYYPVLGSLGAPPAPPQE
ncbi:TIGR04206 family protein [Halonotius terrestris]|uniref:TIGR04206 family protein n=1 Tax=Halonotius terrestris TaxID=2487750 RepID=A0A8J8TDC4_9EURY|nr:TIGR04206 family protein [Halonotius terrestris]TQQ83381.1 TIGR04206 family protein [Halonotius terrestris]